MKKKPGRKSIRSDELVAKILADIQAGDSERTAVLANDAAWPTWSEWKRDDPQLAYQCECARAKGNRNLRRELLETSDPVRAKVRMHLLGCRDRELSARQMIEHSGAVRTIADIMREDVLQEPCE